MMGLGLREWVGLAMLAIGLVIAATFLNPAAGGSDRPPSFSQGQTVGPSTPRPRPPTPVGPTPTPVAVPQPPGWLVEFFDISADGAQRRAATGLPDTLDLAFPAAPFPGMRDDSFLVVAQAGGGLPPARYTFTLEYDCELRVLVAGSEVASAPDPGAAATLVVAFEHDGRGPAELRIECRDRGGPFLLRWKGP